MNIQDLNDLANEVMVARLIIDQSENRIQELIEQNPEIVELQDLISSTKLRKESTQNALLAAMSANDLKSWKTDQANFARAKRVSVSLDPAYKKEVEGLLKTGEEVEGFTLKTSEYMSIKLNK